MNNITVKLPSWRIHPNSGPFFSERDIFFFIPLNTGRSKLVFPKGCTVKTWTVLFLKNIKYYPTLTTVIKYLFLANKQCLLIWKVPRFIIINHNFFAMDKCLGTTTRYTLHYTCGILIFFLENLEKYNI